MWQIMLHFIQYKRITIKIIKKHTTMNKFSWFKKYYSKGNVIPVLGGRVTNSSLKYHISDNKERELFLKTFYDECPCIPFIGDNIHEQHYLLKKFWNVYDVYIGTKEVIKHSKTTKDKLAWVMNFICEVCDENDTYKWYMNPEKDTYPKGCWIRRTKFMKYLFNNVN